ncbi:MAG TPA: NrfJ, partial [Nitrosomonas nitrosa]|nr:NrfJ [Nitrosomonas nitrosa]
FWIAAPTTKVKIGDHIRFAESMTMHNFTSKTLNRTFNRLVFVTSTQVKVAQ